MILYVNIFFGGIILINNKVELCGINTAELPNLKPDEKEELLKKISEGDENARQIFIFSNLRLVLSILQRFNSRKEMVDDIFQVGCIGLIKSIDNFDIEQGVQFSTYAVPMIMGEIKRYLRDNNAIRVSRSLRDIAYKVLQTKESFMKKNFREPTIDEIAKANEFSKEDISQAMEAIQDPLSLFEPVYHSVGDTVFLMDQLGDNKNTDEKWLENLSLTEGLKKLGEREKIILHLRFFEGKTQMEIADEIGISQAQISRLEKNALKLMKKHVQ